MGSSSQHYRGTARTFTEEWENVTEYTGVTASSYWKREHHRDWSSMVEELRWTWELHVYVTASLFSVLAVLCLFTVLRLRSQLSHSKNLTSINVFLGLLATSRLLVLYLDPYGSKLILPAVMLQVLWDLGYPCLVSAFCLLQLAVVRAEGAEKGAQRVTRLTESTASIVITFHFCLIITSGVLGAVQNWLRIVWIITQVVFIVWGGFLFLSTLLGCLRTLRSIVNLPIRLLAQVDPGCEVNSIVPLGMFTEEAPSEQTQRPQQNHHPHHPHHPPKSDHPPHQHHPRIHITDVDEQTYSYASNASLAAQQHQLHRSESMPMRCPPAMSPTHPLPDEQKRKQKMKASHLTSPNEDPASIKPLIDRPRRYTLADQKGRNQARGPATIFGFEPRSPKQSLSPSLMPSILAEDIKNETRHPCRSRFEKNLRHLVFTSCLGIALCLLRAYDVFGLDGLMACGNTGPVLQWFFFQTISRFVELCMAFSLVCGSQRCMNSRYYYYRN